MPTQGAVNKLEIGFIFVTNMMTKMFSREILQGKVNLMSWRARGGVAVFWKTQVLLPNAVLPVIFLRLKQKFEFRQIIISNFFWSKFGNEKKNIWIYAYDCKNEIRTFFLRKMNDLFSCFFYFDVGPIV